MCFLFLFSCPTSLRNGSCISSFLDCFRALLAYPPDSMFAAEGSLSFIGTAMERGKHSCLAGRARICRDLTSDELRRLCSHTSRRCPMGFPHRRASTLARLLCPTGTPLADCFIRRPFEEPAYGLGQRHGPSLAKTFMSKFLVILAAVFRSLPSNVVGSVGH
jgi:hypothetical protein